MKTQRIGTMFGDLMHSLITPPVTRRYPFERFPVPTRLRGKLIWNPASCIGCGLCVKDCPADAIDLITLDKQAKRFVMHYRVDRCTFCAQCVESCRRGSLQMSNEEWELAAIQRSDFDLYYGEANDIQAALAGSPAPEPAPAG
jgi:NAD(P)H-quinone oxidoreductase subunit I